MDSRAIPVLLAAGWLLVTLGLWGSTGHPWWIWPLSVGTALILTGAGYGWSMWRQLLAKAANRSEAERFERRSA